MEFILNLDIIQKYLKNFENFKELLEVDLHCKKL